MGDTPLEVTEAPPPPLPSTGNRNGTLRGTAEAGHWFLLLLRLPCGRWSQDASPLVVEWLEDGERSSRPSGSSKKMSSLSLKFLCRIQSNEKLKRSNANGTCNALTRRVGKGLVHQRKSSQGKLCMRRSRFLLARIACAYTSARSIGFCAIWVCLSTSSSSRRSRSELTISFTCKKVGYGKYLSSDLGAFKQSFFALPVAVHAGGNRNYDKEPHQHLRARPHLLDFLQANWGRRRAWTLSGRGTQRWVSCWLQCWLQSWLSVRLQCWLI